MIKKFIGLFILSLLILSCNSQRRIITETEYIHDTVHIEKVVTEIQFKDKVVKITEPTITTQFLPCPDDVNFVPIDLSTKQNNNTTTAIFDPTKKGWIISSYCDSIVNIYEKEFYLKDTKIDSLMKTQRIVNTDSKETIIKKNFFQNLISDIYLILLIFVTILWIFGVTPKYILKMVVRNR